LLRQGDHWAVAEDWRRHVAQEDAFVAKGNNPSSAIAAEAERRLEDVATQWLYLPPSQQSASAAPPRMLMQDDERPRIMEHLHPVALTTALASRNRQAHFFGPAFDGYEIRIAADVLLS